MKEVNDIMQMLNWNNDIATQEQGMNFARQITELQLFFQPMEFGSKAVWDNCAKILAEKSDDVLAPYLENLIDWLQDLNWPGAFTIMYRLKSFSGEKLEIPFLKFVTNATKLKNKEEGLMWLDYLSELLDNEELKKRLPKEVVEILQKHYHNWGWWVT